MSVTSKFDLTILPAGVQLDPVVTLSAPDQALDITSVSNEIVHALGARDSVTSGPSANGLVFGDHDNTIVLDGPDQSLSAHNRTGDNDHVVMSGNRDSVSVSGFDTIDVYGSNASITSLPTGPSDNIYPFFGTTDVVMHGNGSATVQGSNLHFLGGRRPLHRHGQRHDVHQHRDRRWKRQRAVHRR